MPTKILTLKYYQLYSKSASVHNCESLTMHTLKAIIYYYYFHSAASVVTNNASHDYCEIADTQSPTHENTTSTGDYHVLEEGSPPQAMLPPVTGGNDPPGTNDTVSACGTPTTTLQEVWLQCTCT